MLHDLLKDLVGGHAIGQGLVRKHQTMAEDVRHQVGHVLRQDIASAAEERQGPCPLDQVNRGAGACPVGEIRSQLGNAETARVPRGGREEARDE